MSCNTHCGVCSFTPEASETTNPPGETTPDMQPVRTITLTAGSVISFLKSVETKNPPMLDTPGCGNLDVTSKSSTGDSGILAQIAWRLARAEEMRMFSFFHSVRFSLFCISLLNLWIKLSFCLGAGLEKVQYSVLVAQGS